MTPTDVANRALDEIGVPAIGDITEHAVCLRTYDPTLRQLHAAALWNFAKRTQTLHAIDSTLVTPRLYVYEWPIDCVHPRHLNWRWPVPFEIADYPLPNPAGSDWQQIEGHSPESTRVILCNLPNAELVYTGLVQFPSMWDPLFEEAMVRTLAAKWAMPLRGGVDVSPEDKKFVLQLRRDNIELARMALETARVRDANEGHNFMPTVDAEWITARSASGTMPLSAPLTYALGWRPMPMIDNA